MTEMSFCCNFPFENETFDFESNQTNDGKPTFTLGFLGSFKFGLTLGKLIAGAIPLAIDHVNRSSINFR